MCYLVFKMEREITTHVHTHTHTYFCRKMHGNHKPEINDRGWVDIGGGNKYGNETFLSVPFLYSFDFEPCKYFIYSII